jgi:hypothetical protein
MDGPSVAAAIDKHKGGRGGRETPCPGGREGAGAALAVPAVVGETGCRGGGATTAGVGESKRRGLRKTEDNGRSRPRPVEQPPATRPAVQAVRHHRRTRQHRSRGQTARRCRHHRTSAPGSRRSSRTAAGPPPAQQQPAGADGRCLVGEWGLGCGEPAAGSPGRFTKTADGGQDHRRT